MTGLLQALQSLPKEDVAGILKDVAKDLKWHNKFKVEAIRLLYEGINNPDVGFTTKAEYAALLEDKQYHFIPQEMKDRIIES